MAEPLVITRVTHSCHLIQIGGMTVLADPWSTSVEPLAGTRDMPAGPR